MLTVDKRRGDVSPVFFVCKGDLGLTMAADVSGGMINS